MNRNAIIALLVVPTMILSVLPAFAQSASPGDAYISPGGSVFRILLDDENLGNKDIEIGELVLPPGTESASHAHGSLEIFYVVEGLLEHIVNGQSHMLEPGMVGFVHAGDQVVHKIPGEKPTKVLVIWVPGGESSRPGRIRATWRHEARPPKP